MSIWIVVIFVVLTLIGFVMVGIGFHEKTKHKDNPAGKPGKTYDILLYAGIALAVIGIIGSIWSMISYSKSKKTVVMAGPPVGMYGPRGMSPSDEGDEDESMMPPPRYAPQGPPGYAPQGPPGYAPQGPPGYAPQGPPAPYCILPDGRYFDLKTYSLMSSVAPSAPSMNPFATQSQQSACNNNTFNLEDFMRSAKLLKELKDIINGN
jgi:hypothetical protein